MATDYDTSVAEYLYQNRIAYLAGEITTDMAAGLVARLLVLESIDHGAEIRLYISSYGGSVHAGLQIYDTMQMIEAPVATFAIGPAFSMAAWLLAAGEPGRRYATPNSRIMLHQTSAGVQGSSADIRVAAENVLKTEKLLNEILARHTGRGLDEIERAIQRDLWMTPEEAHDFGILDHVAPPCARKLVSAAGLVSAPGGAYRRTPRATSAAGELTLVRAAAPAAPASTGERGGPLSCPHES